MGSSWIQKFILSRRFHVSNRIRPQPPRCTNADGGKHRQSCGKDDCCLSLFHPLISDHTGIDFLVAFRYRKLREMYEESMVGAGGVAGVGRGASNMASSMTEVTLISLAAASCTVEPAKKRLPGTMTVGKLKQLCKRLFKVDTDQQVSSDRLFFWCVPFQLFSVT